jgi:hypothetical protein
MVLLLISDVPHYLAAARLAHAKRAVTGLPGKFSELGPFLMNPSRGIGFEHPHAVGNAQIAIQPQQQMHMVIRAAYHQRCPAHLPDNAPQVGLDLVPNGID